jgi:AcrR family transcriptional regulator
MDKAKSDKKDHILDVAEKIFSDHGFDGASTRSISGQAGVNVAMLNYYFGSKVGLFLAVVNRKISSFNDILQHISGSENLSAWRKVENYIELYSNKVVANNNFHKLIYNEMGMNCRSELAGNLRTILMQNVDELRKILREGIANGDFKPDTDVEMVTATLYGTRNFTMNKPQMTSALFGYDILDEELLEEQFRPRLTNYLKDILRSYLIENGFTKQYAT